jgi:hypothetical protein
MSYFPELVPVPEEETAHLASLAKNKKQVEEIRFARECLRKGVLIDIDFVRNFYGTAYRVVREFPAWSDGISASFLTCMYIQELNRIAQRKMLTRLQQLLAMNRAQQNAAQKPHAYDWMRIRE